ncbi:hypothetical protein Pmani_000876 [Petrolisthes manimaculis]|uniref:Ribosome assembly protein 1 n=1 Tax=Petrolisthes manimaculis TaxID=1843537 RepID=A0AAE1QNA5_9EUCA|nr:hypothetical protein Pmani_000876 [Petrolisthes manimaculis]
MVAGERKEGEPTLMGNPNNIRNLCIMAHVDHGKTSLADALLASNGIINQQQAGRIRYMDSDKKEIERGITMKSSCVSLLYKKESQNYLVNLIDSPGHVDFSWEVSTAVRLCDGAIIVVDVVDGVCAQTKVVLKQAWAENIHPVLVLNKIDRLILETKMSPIDCYYHITQVLEQVNAYMGELYNTALLGKNKEEIEERQRMERERKVSERERKVSESKSPEASLNFADWGIETEDDSHLYFSPEQGNVVFASAFDGWGFSIHHFAVQLSAKLGMNKDVLMKTLWGDYYITSKGGEKRILSGARDKRKSPLFVTLILENLYKVYDVVMNKKDKIEIEKLATILGVKIHITIDERQNLHSLCSGWLPLASAVLDMVVVHLPSAASITEERAARLMCSATKRFDSLPQESQKLKQAFVRCSGREGEPIIVYVSKMFGVARKNLPQNSTARERVSGGGGRVQQGAMCEEELAARREEIRRMREVAKGGQTSTENGDGGRPLTEEELAEIVRHQQVIAEEKRVAEEVRKKYEEEVVFVAFARVFSGTLRPGDKVYVLGPKHDPATALALLKEEDISEELVKNYQHIQVCQVLDLYLMFGREFERLESASAGSLVGITGLAGCVVKSATLASTPALPAFTELTHNATPILRVAVEPNDPRDLPKLRAGLKLLNQADPCVQILLQQSGEYVMLTAGEIHLQRCVDDLQELYAKVPVHISDPIVPFRETIIPTPIYDRLNEAILGENVNTRKDEKLDPHGVVEVENRVGRLRVRAAPLPASVTALLEQHQDLLKLLQAASGVHSALHRTTKVGLNEKENTNTTDTTTSEAILDDINKDSEVGVEQTDSQKMSEESALAVTNLKKSLEKEFQEAGPEWDGVVDQIWSFGPSGCGPNLLLNQIKSYPRPSVWEPAILVDSPLTAYDISFITGFQMATGAGPLCDEPMMGVCFIVEDWSLAVTTSQEDDDGEHSLRGPSISSGQVISFVKDNLKLAFENQCQRLMCAMYSCVISVTTEVVGRMYSVINKRQGRIVDGDITEGSTSWNVTAYIPVIESMNFANELRISTSGEAMPQLVFSHWEMLDMDPFWEPQTTEELTHWGEKSDTDNLAMKYMKDVRKRKGLAIDEKIVEFAEKQRTLTRNK